MARLWMFAGALLAYALFGTPTPDHIGIAEMIVAAGLIAAAGAVGLMQAAGLTTASDTGRPPWIFPARLCLLYGVSVPLLAGLAQGHDPALMLRDIIPFLFLLLPLFLPVSFLDRAPLPGLFPYILCLMGLIFVLRVLVPFLSAGGSDGGLIGFAPDPKNFVNSPSVLFAALFLTGAGGCALTGKSTPGSLLWAGACFLLTGICLYGMAAIGQRAHMGAWALTLVFWMGILAIRRPLSLVRVMIVSAMVAVFAFPLAADIAQGLVQKNTAVGLNNRIEEARVVYESFQDRPAALLFGQGWGATIISPAVGPSPVNYTHNLLTTYLLKTGLAGLALLLTYIVSLGAGLWRILWIHPVAGLALAAPFLIDLTLYASFKSLDFGLLLVLVSLWTRWPERARQSCQNTPVWCMQNHNNLSG